jgi:hypothetical protein
MAYVRKTVEVAFSFLTIQNEGNVGYWVVLQAGDFIDVTKKANIVSLLMSLNTSPGYQRKWMIGN